MNNMGRILLEPLLKARGLGRALHKDDRGDNENLGRLLILALVLVPLVVLIAFFGDNIWKKAECQWDKVFKTDVTSGSSANKTDGC